MAKESKDKVTKYFAPDSFFSSETGQVAARSLVDLDSVRAADLVKKGHLQPYDAKAHKLRSEAAPKNKAEQNPKNK